MGHQSPDELDSYQKVESLILFLGPVLTGTVVFGGWLPLAKPPYPPYPPGFFCFPILLWAAIRFGPRESATATFILSVIAVIGTVMVSVLLLMELSTTDSCLSKRSWASLD